MDGEGLTLSFPFLYRFLTYPLSEAAVESAICKVNKLLIADITKSQIVPRVSLLDEHISYSIESSITRWISRYCKSHLRVTTLDQKWQVHLLWNVSDIMTKTLHCTCETTSGILRIWITLLKIFYKGLHFSKWNNWSKITGWWVVFMLKTILLKGIF